MRAIRFSETRELADGRIFLKDSVHLLNDASAWHHVKRGFAEFCGDAVTQPEADAIVAPQLDPPAEEEEDGDTVESPEDDVGGQDGDSPGERPILDIVPSDDPAPTRRSTRRNSRGQ